MLMRFQGRNNMIRNDFYVNELIDKLNSKDRVFRIAIFIWGVLIYALSFSLFYSPNNIVSGGSTGLSLVAKEVFNIDTSLFVLIVSFILLIVCYIFLGKTDTIKALLGSMLLPVFMEFSSVYYGIFDFHISSLFMVVFIGGMLMGLGNGMIIRSGYNVGGFQVIYLILYRKFGISIGKSSMFLNSIIIFIGGIFFGFDKALYAVIGLYICNTITDKVMLESSATKTFYIVTDKYKDIREYIVSNLGCNVTIMDAKGGYSNKSKKILMCAIPTRQYYEMKKMIENIDEEVFFLITDTYEIYGGV